MADPKCPTCGPTTLEPHPRRSGVMRCTNCKEHLAVAETTTEDVYRAALDRLDEARRRLDAALIASAHLLDKPFTNAPETSPWERSVKPAMYALRRAVAAVRADGDAAYAAGREAAAQAIGATLVAREAQGCTYIRIADVRQALGGER